MAIVQHKATLRDTAVIPMMHSPTKETGDAHPRMVFSCSERWEDMVPKGNDRHCLKCQKPVIDFTNWDRDSVVAYFKEKPNSCGQFTQEQLEPELVPVSNMVVPIRKGFFAALAALAIQSSAAQERTPSDPGTEQTMSSATEPRAFKMPLNSEGLAMKADGPYCPKPVPQKQNLPKRGYRLYTSGNFPFLHIRRRVFRGKVTIGCPSF